MKKHNVSRSQKLLLPAILLFAALVGFGITQILMPSSSKNEPPKCDGTCVSLFSDKAFPDTITVKNGSYVQFNSADGKTHELSLGEGGSGHEHVGKFQSGEIGADEAWRVQFSKDGAYYFHDHLNPKINVFVVVYTPGKDYTIKR